MLDKDVVIQPKTLIVIDEIEGGIRETTFSINNVSGEITKEAITLFIERKPFTLNLNYQR